MCFHRGAVRFVDEIDPSFVIGWTRLRAVETTAAFVPIAAILGRQPFPDSELACGEGELRFFVASLQAFLRDPA